MVRIDITITQQQIEYLKRVCRDIGLTRSDYIRRLIDKDISELNGIIYPDRQE